MDIHSSHILALLALTLALSCVKEQDYVPVDDETAKVEAPSVVPDVAIVKFSDDMVDLIEDDLDSGKVVTKSASLNSMVDELGITSMTRVFPDAGEFEARTRAEGLHKWYRIVYSQSVPKTKADDYLSSLPGIESVEEQRTAKPASGYFNDPLYPAQWHYCSSGTGKFATGADIDVEPVWKNYTSGSSNVIVAVVDGGIDLTHEDLASNTVGDKGSGSFNFVDFNDTIVAHRHGTHVAGTIAAINNNGKGVCGVAGGDCAKGQKGVRLLSCQIFKRNTATGKDISADGALAIKWGCDHGAVIANNSWGYTYDTYAEAKAATTSSYIKAAIDYFIKYAGYNSAGAQIGPMAGGVVVFAAGNENWDISHPADYENVIAVGSTNCQLGKSSFSNYGSWVDICAPGGYAYYNNTDIESTFPGNTYGVMAGTSMSCPHVSGVAALLVSYYGGKGFTNTKLKSMLLGGANTTKIPSSAQIGPFLDAMGSFNYGKLAPPSVVSDYTVKNNSNTAADLTFKVTSSTDGLKAYGYLLIASLDSMAVVNYNPSSPTNVLFTNVSVGLKKTGEEISGSISGLSLYGKYYVGIVGYNYYKKYSAVSRVKSVSMGVNHPPVISALTPPPYSLKSKDVNVYSFTLNDPDNHKFTTTFDGGSAAAVASFGQGGVTCDVTISGTGAPAGTYTAKFVATDAYEASTSYSFQYTIAPNQPPVVIKSLDNTILYGVGDQISFDMTQYMKDEDDDVLTYSCRGYDENILSYSVNGKMLIFKTLGYGLTPVTVVGNDGGGKECSTSFDILVKDKGNLVEAYPNPVRDKLNIRTEAPAETSIRIVNSSGAVIYNATSVVGAFAPAVVDMSKCSPGVYGLTVSYSGHSISRSIGKR